MFFLNNSREILLIIFITLRFITKNQNRQPPIACPFIRLWLITNINMFIILSIYSVIVILNNSNSKSSKFTAIFRHTLR
jgi:hypothetical protein